ncbi:MAG: SDR family NAD(P)-dependent oxidoreductase, partial [Mycobacterium sp.]|nr:SDR family NAD(P)-dependent oxidoreductase [Mycobacterium sp.]
MSGQRVAVIIGGASGIGWASAGKLAAEGCRVVIADRNVDGARERAAELGAPHTWAQVEVTDEDSVARLFDDVVAREGGVHVVVNCAG